MGTELNETYSYLYQGLFQEKKYVNCEHNNKINNKIA